MGSCRASTSPDQQSWCTAGEAAGQLLQHLNEHNREANLEIEPVQGLRSVIGISWKCTLNAISFSFLWVPSQGSNQLQREFHLATY